MAAAGHEMHDGSESEDDDAFNSVQELVDDSGEICEQADPESEFGNKTNATSLLNSSPQDFGGKCVSRRTVGVTQRVLRWSQTKRTVMKHLHFSCGVIHEQKCA